MSAALAIWSAYVEPGKKFHLVAQSDIRITGAALDAKLNDEKARSSVKITYVTPQAIDESDDEEEPLPPTTTAVLCSLTPGKIEQSSLDLIINEDDEVEFEIVGKNAIYLSGNYITQPTDFPADDSELDTDEEVAYDLRDVSSDVEMDASELDHAEIDSEEDDSHRFEVIRSSDEEKANEVKKEVKEVKAEEKQIKKEEAHKKRPRESDAAESGTDGEQKLSKKQLKKLNKKLKAENGSAVPNGGAKQEEKEGHQREDKKEKKIEKKKGSEHDAAAKQGETKTTESGLKVKDVKTGQGKAAKKGDSVSIRYIGRFMDGSVFDSNIKGKPLSFRLGNREVIKGWDEGIVGMRVGGERILVVPPHLGYGARRNGKIPGNSTLSFKCELLMIK